MKLLFLGYSNIVQRRVLPAATAVAALHGIDIASHRPATDLTLPPTFNGRCYPSYDEALRQSDAELVYVSTVNAEHGRWVEAALQHGRHVIVDKPALASVAETERLLSLAARQGTCLAEANVYGYHPQIQQIQTLFAQANTAVSRIVALFSFPPFPADNFRYRQALMGGALWDLGPYAISPGRLFFGEEPLSLECHINQWGEEVDTAFSLLARYSHGRTVVGHFGFDTGYVNQLKLLGPNMVVTVDRVYTTPPELTNSLAVEQGTSRQTVPVPAADSFAEFLTAVCHAIQQNQLAPFGQTMLSDARVLERLRQTALASH